MNSSRISPLAISVLVLLTLLGASFWSRHFQIVKISRTPLERNLDRPIRAKLVSDPQSRSKAPLDAKRKQTNVVEDVQKQIRASEVKSTPAQVIQDVQNQLEKSDPTVISSPTSSPSRKTSANGTPSVKATESRNTASNTPRDRPAESTTPSKQSTLSQADGELLSADDVPPQVDGVPFGTKLPAPEPSRPAELNTTPFPIIAAKPEIETVIDVPVPLVDDVPPAIQNIAKAKKELLSANDVPPQVDGVPFGTKLPAPEPSRPAELNTTPFPIIAAKPEIETVIDVPVPLVDDVPPAIQNIAKAKKELLSANDVPPQVDGVPFGTKLPAPEPSRPAELNTTPFPIIAAKPEIETVIDVPVPLVDDVPPAIQNIAKAKKELLSANDVPPQVDGVPFGTELPAPEPSRPTKLNPTPFPTIAAKPRIHSVIDSPPQFTSDTESETELSLPALTTLRVPLIPDFHFPEEETGVDTFQQIPPAPPLPESGSKGSSVEKSFLDTTLKLPTVSARDSFLKVPEPHELQTHRTETVEQKSEQTVTGASQVIATAKSTERAESSSDTIRNSPQIERELPSPQIELPEPEDQTLRPSSDLAHLSRTIPAQSVSPKVVSLNQRTTVGEREELQQAFFLPLVDASPSITQISSEMGTVDIICPVDATIVINKRPYVETGIQRRYKLELINDTVYEIEAVCQRGGHLLRLPTQRIHVTDGAFSQSRLVFLPPKSISISLEEEKRTLEQLALQSQQPPLEAKRPEANRKPEDQSKPKLNTNQKPPAKQESQPEEAPLPPKKNTQSSKKQDSVKPKENSKSDPKPNTQPVSTPPKESKVPTKDVPEKTNPTPQKTHVLQKGTQPGDAVQKSSKYPSPEWIHQGSKPAKPDSPAKPQSPKVIRHHLVEPPTIGPRFTLNRNSKRPNGRYLGHVRYRQADASFELELTSASRDVKIQQHGELPDDLFGQTPVLMAQMVANSGERTLPLGLQLNLGKGSMEHGTLRFPFYHAVDGHLQPSILTGQIEKRLNSPFHGIPPSLKAKQVEVHLWVQFGHHRYRVQQPMMIELQKEKQVPCCD